MLYEPCLRLVSYFYVCIKVYKYFPEAVEQSIKIQASPLAELFLKTSAEHIQKPIVETKTNEQVF